MSKGARFGGSVEVQVGVGLLSLCHIWDEPHGSKGDKHQFDKQRGSGGSLDKTSSGETKLLNHPRDHPSVQDWCWMLWRLQPALGDPCVLQKLLFLSPCRHFDQHSDPGLWFFHLPSTYALDECI